MIPWNIEEKREKKKGKMIMVIEVWAIDKINIIDSRDSAIF